MSRDYWSIGTRTVRPCHGIRHKVRSLPCTISRCAPSGRCWRRLCCRGCVVCCASDVAAKRAVLARRCWTEPGPSAGPADRPARLPTPRSSQLSRRVRFSSCPCAARLRLVSVSSSGASELHRRPLARAPAQRQLPRKEAGEPARKPRQRHLGRGCDRELVGRGGSRDVTL